jgi:hypothetical protein
MASLCKQAEHLRANETMCEVHVASHMLQHIVEGEGVLPGGRCCSSLDVP